MQRFLLTTILALAIGFAGFGQLLSREKFAVCRTGIIRNSSDEMMGVLMLLEG